MRLMMIKQINARLQHATRSQLTLINRFIRLILP